jgi:hypothetical protein
MAAMDGNSQPSATFYATNGRNLVSQASLPVLSAELNSHEQQQGTGTWHMKSASRGEIPITRHIGDHGWRRTDIRFYIRFFDSIQFWHGLYSITEFENSDDFVHITTL